MGELLLFHFRVTNVKLINKKIFLITLIMIIITIIFIILRTSYNIMFLAFPGMLKSRSGMNGVSNRWESFRSLFRGFFPLVPETFNFKVLIARLPATYNDGSFLLPLLIRYIELLQILNKSGTQVNETSSVNNGLAKTCLVVEMVRSN